MRRGVVLPLLAAALVFAGWATWATWFRGHDTFTGFRNARVLVLPAAPGPRAVAVLPCQVGSVEQFVGYSAEPVAQLAAAGATVLEIPAGGARVVYVPGCLGAQVGTGGTGNVGSGLGGFSALGEHHTAPTAAPVTAWVLRSLRGTGLPRTGSVTLPAHRTIRTVVIPRCTGHNNGAGAGGPRTDLAAVQGTTAIAPPCATGAG